MERYGSRKFLVTLLSMASATGLVLVKAIPPEVWGMVLSTVVLTYVGGNVAQKATVKG
jgi:hypothetical protein